MPVAWSSQVDRHWMLFDICGTVNCMLFMPRQQSTPASSTLWPEKSPSSSTSLLAASRSRVGCTSKAMSLPRTPSPIGTRTSSSCSPCLCATFSPSFCDMHMSC